jgi:Flp pilus assembly protein TadG
MARRSIQRRDVVVSMRPGRRGQGLVEFALVLPIFMLLIFAVIDGGRYVYVNSTLSNAAREGARLGSVEASWRGSTDPSCGTTGGPVCPANNAVLVQHITSAANRQMAPFGAVDNVYLRCVAASGTPPTGEWTGVSCGSNAAGGYLSIRVTFTWSAMTPVVGNIMGDITSSASATVFIN